MLNFDFSSKVSSARDQADHPRSMPQLEHDYPRERNREGHLAGLIEPCLCLTETVIRPMLLD